RFKPAERAALKAARDFPALLGGAHIVVDQASNRKGSLYRARLVGLTKQDARAACRQLEARKTDCLVVKPNLALALTTAQ
ncbi:MAG TPA: SPOR domain-containing protein, partial [Dongiaceae bacterium]|nr:SPOR domain-containing protein [Dongiaceae bacterium]